MWRVATCKTDVRLVDPLQKRYYSAGPGGQTVYLGTSEPSTGGYIERYFGACGQDAVGILRMLKGERENLIRKRKHVWHCCVQQLTTPYVFPICASPCDID